MDYCSGSPMENYSGVDTLSNEKYNYFNSLRPFFDFNPPSSHGLFRRG